MRTTIVACAVLAFMCPLERCSLFGPTVFAVTQPGGGDEVAQGSAVDVRWSLGSNSGASVDITLERGGAEVLTIVSGTSNDGSVRWFVPADLERGSGYRIEIDDGTQTAVSGSFSVVAPRPVVGVTESNLTFPVGSRRDTIQVFNDGPMGTTLDFAVETNRSWLLVSPDSGTSTGRGDRVTITVEVVEARLQPGPNNGRLTVEARGVSGVRDVEIDVVANRPVQ